MLDRVDHDLRFSVMVECCIYPIYRVAVLQPQVSKMCCRVNALMRLLSEQLCDRGSIQFDTMLAVKVLDIKSCGKLVTVHQ